VIVKRGKIKNLFAIKNTKGGSETKSVRLDDLICLEAISKPLFRRFAAFVPAERGDVAKSAQLVTLNLENSG
jgi:hypothetical protein